MPINTAQALDLRLNKGLSYQRIAAIQDVDPAQLFRTIKPLLPDPDNQAFKDQRGDIFSSLQLKILSSISTQDLKKAPLQSKVVAAGILYDKERLERGLATERIDHVHLSAKLEDLQRERERLSALLQVKKLSCNPTSIKNTESYQGDK